MTFNRTIVELKYVSGLATKQEVQAFNRTIVELKCQPDVPASPRRSSF